ncbi:MAG: hypothetical protein DWQ01_14610 [Planctomycetota bacterium]|nr:MAG: hypothetical protein DWQ01_14610 [Planctomycetota bacterium]
MEQIKPEELQQKLEAGEALRLVDVREPAEWDICRLPGAELKPLSQILQWQDELQDHSGPKVIYCHHGVRSAQAVAYLHSLGVESLVNLQGGIDAWARTVDPQMAQY